MSAFTVVIELDLDIAHGALLASVPPGHCGAE